MTDFGAPLKVFVDHKDDGASDGTAEQPEAERLGTTAQGGDRDGDEQAAGQQDHGVAATEPDIELFAG